jgi:hypothetical protein
LGDTSHSQSRPHPLRLELEGTSSPANYVVSLRLTSKFTVSFSPPARVWLVHFSFRRVFATQSLNVNNQGFQWWAPFIYFARLTLLIITQTCAQSLFNMSHPLYWPSQQFFYPIGNTPAISLTQDLSPEQSADILLLGCGDPRNILFTLYSDVTTGSSRSIFVSRYSLATDPEIVKCLEIWISLVVILSLLS